MLGLMENQLKYENIPNGYELCFNNNCQQRECCLHYQAYRLQWRKRSIATHFGRFNPSTFESEIGLKMA